MALNAASHLIARPRTDRTLRARPFGRYQCTALASRQRGDGSVHTLSSLTALTSPVAACLANSWPQQPTTQRGTTSQIASQPALSSACASSAAVQHASLNWVPTLASLRSTGYAQ
jgi:hypothetical protein